MKSGMHREEPHELVEPLVHVPVEPRERRQVLADARLLLARLAEQPLGHDVLDVGPRDADLLEAVLHPPQAVGHVLEAGAVEDRLLHAGDETEAQVLRDLAHLAQEVQVEDQLLVLPALEIVEQLVDDEQQPLVGVPFVERRHHVLEGALVVRDGVAGREAVVDVPARQRLLELRADERAEVHGRGAELGARDLEPARDALRRAGDPGVGRTDEIGPLGDGRQHGHQVGLAGAVVADDQEALVVGGLVDLDLRDHDIREPLRHLGAHDVGGHELARLGLAIGVPKLHHGLDRLELDQVAVSHLGFRADVWPDPDGRPSVAKRCVGSRCGRDCAARGRRPT